MSIILEPYFWDEQAAHAKLEEIVWPNGPVCTHCGATDRIGAVTGKGARAGLKFCCRCRKQFRATIGTMFEGSHVPLHIPHPLRGRQRMIKWGQQFAR